MELVAQLVRVPGCGPGGRGFKSPRAPIFFFIISLPRSSRGLGRRPFTAVTRVQIPYAVHHSIPGFSKTWDFFCLPSAVICLSHSRILANTTSIAKAVLPRFKSRTRYIIQSQVFPRLGIFSCSSYLICIIPVHPQSGIF